jgi:Flp pilus assembly protein TadD
VGWALPGLTWFLLTAALLGVSACGGPDAGGLSDSAPGIGVARAALEGGAADVALRVSAENLARDPENRDFMLVQADALAALGRGQEADAAYRRVLVADKDSVEARMGLGRLALNTNPAAAETFFLETLARDPRNAKAFNNLGIARDLLGRHPQAQDAYRRALGIAPSMQAATVNLALSLAMSGRADDGLKLLGGIDPAQRVSPRMRHDIAAVHAMAGDRAGAEALLSKDLSPADLDQTLRGYEALRPPAATPTR